MKVDGRQIAKDILGDLKSKIQKLSVIPHLAIILLDNDPASIAYVNQKKIKAELIGAKTTIKHLPSETPQSDLLSAIQQFNNNSNIHGIIVQQPLPAHIDTQKVIDTIDPKKDVDGSHPQSKFEPPIAAAVLEILKKTRINSKKIIVLGKGETGGKLIIQTIKKKGIEPTVIDSKTKDPQSITKKADIIISAVGKKNVIKPEMVKKGVILVGVGLYKGIDGKMHGDYDEEKIKNIASFYTPTPGGVGPVNVAMLLNNLVTASESLTILHKHRLI